MTSMMCRRKKLSARCLQLQMKNQMLKLTSTNAKNTLLKLKGHCLIYVSNKTPLSHHCMTSSRNGSEDARRQCKELTKQGGYNFGFQQKLSVAYPINELPIDINMWLIVTKEESKKDLCKYWY